MADLSLMLLDVPLLTSLADRRHANWTVILTSSSITEEHSMDGLDKVLPCHLIREADGEVCVALKT